MEDVARYLRIGRTAAYELARRSDFPAIRVGRLVRVNREAFLRWCGHPTYRANGHDEMNPDGAVGNV
nr:helix-turn-helix domain-containing protein [Alicyclobacillus macrosporangiidus]